MASRENQVLHVALILLVMFTVLLCVFTYWFYSKSVTAQNERDTARQQLAQAQKEQRAENFKVQKLTFMISGGVKKASELADELANIRTDANDEELTRMVTTFEQNMMLFGPADQEYKSARNYEAMPNFLLSRIRDLNQQLVDLRRSETKLTAEKAQLEQAEKARTKQFQDAEQKARDDLAAQSAKFQQDRAEVVKKRDELAQMIGEKDKQIADVNAKLAETDKRLNSRIKELAGIVDNIKNRLKNFKTETFEVADATITSVNQKARVVYVDVGSADLLRRQQTFSVFAKGTAGLMKAEPKGRVEVTQILGEHVAMCRILEDDLSQIIMPGDVLFTPAWSPGQRIHFAISGFIDITGNGRSDRDLLLSLISINGGNVDDAVSVQTRYLIVGERRGAQPGGEMTQAEERQINDSIRDAQEIGVDQISVDKLLTLMGWRADVQSVNIGRGDFQTNAEKKTDEAKKGTPFRPRTPPRGKAGAF